MSCVFGPVPARRLGRAVVMSSTPRIFYEPQEIISQVKERIIMCEKSGDRIDYLTTVPDGEPTLDIHLGELISGLHADWSLVKQLVDDRLSLETAYGGSRFYVRKFRERQSG